MTILAEPNRSVAKRGSEFGGRAQWRELQGLFRQCRGKVSELNLRTATLLKWSAQETLLDPASKSRGKPSPCLGLLGRLGGVMHMFRKRVWPRYGRG